MRKALNFNKHAFACLRVYVCVVFYSPRGREVFPYEETGCVVQMGVLLGPHSSSRGRGYHFTRFRKTSRTVCNFYKILDQSPSQGMNVK